MTKVGGLTPYYGKTFRRCPYSQYYWDNYLSLGYYGNSTNPDLSSINISKITAHSDTEGTMTQGHKGSIPGWSCTDDDCYFYITYGYRYFES